MRWDLRRHEFFLPKRKTSGIPPAPRAHRGLESHDHAALPSDHDGTGEESVQRIRRPVACVRGLPLLGTIGDAGVSEGGALRRVQRPPVATVPRLGVQCECEKCDSI